MAQPQLATQRLPRGLGRAMALLPLMCALLGGACAAPAAAPSAPAAAPAATSAPSAGPTAGSTAARPTAGPAGPLNPRVSVKVAVTEINPEVGFYVAQERGYFAEEGLDVEFLATRMPTGDRMAMLARGDIQFAGIS